MLRHFEAAGGPIPARQIQDALHPYVQTPLLPWLLRPLAGAMHYYLLVFPAVAVLARQARLASRASRRAVGPTWNQGWVLIALIVALNLPPLACGYHSGRAGGDKFLSSFLLSALVGLAGLLTVPAAPVAAADPAGAGAGVAWNARLRRFGRRSLRPRHDEAELTPG